MRVTTLIVIGLMLACLQFKRWYDNGRLVYARECNDPLPVQETFLSLTIIAWAIVLIASGFGIVQAINAHTTMAFVPAITAAWALDALMAIEEQLGLVEVEIEPNVEDHLDDLFVRACAWFLAQIRFI